MIAALIDNGSLQPAAHRNLRATAAELAARTGLRVDAVSWNHSDRIRPDALGGEPAWTLRPWLQAQLAEGERDFVFVPFFISAQGAIGSALRRDLEDARREIGAFEYVFAPGLASLGAIPWLVAERIREVIRRDRLARPPVVVVDHGGPAIASATLRNRIADDTRRELGAEIGPLTPASLEGAEYGHNDPLFANILGAPGFDRGDVVVAPLFLGPGRHAGPRGDLAQIASAAEDRGAAVAGPGALRTHFTALVGTHPLVADVLAHSLTQTITTFHAAA